MLLREKLGLTCNFQGFLTMLIKLCDTTIMENDLNKLIMIMNTDSTATLLFVKKILLPAEETNRQLTSEQKEEEKKRREFKDLKQLDLTLRMGDMNVINQHVQYNYNMIKHATENS